MGSVRDSLKKIYAVHNCKNGQCLVPRRFLLDHTLVGSICGICFSHHIHSIRFDASDTEESHVHLRLLAGKRRPIFGSRTRKIRQFQVYIPNDK
jgi:hypothetical protein